MATSIDDNVADEKSGKSNCQLLNIRCTSICKEYVTARTNILWYSKYFKESLTKFNEMVHQALQLDLKKENFELKIELEEKTRNSSTDGVINVSK